VAVGSYPQGGSPYGCLDMVGNVWEWCADWHSEGYYATSPTESPGGPQSGEKRALRGGSWLNSWEGCLCTFRNGEIPANRGDGLGFRCASSLGAPTTPWVDQAAMLQGQQVGMLRELQNEGMQAPADMVLVPAGPFNMGSGDGDAGERPTHMVTLASFWMDRTEVTNQEYGEFLEYVRRTGDHSKCHPDEPRGKDHTPGWWADAALNGPDQPVVGVDWWDACAYAAWAGKRLPTEAEWEKAARGPDGRRYAWGNDWDRAKCNSGEGSKGTVEVAGLPEGASPYGCLNMTGNVWEWCADWLSDSYNSTSPAPDPIGAGTGPMRSFRGGAWMNREYVCRCAYRSGGTQPLRGNGLGFRCARALGQRSPAAAAAPWVDRTAEMQQEQATVLAELQMQGVQAPPDMVLIPPSRVVVGSGDGAHAVGTAGFWIDRTEVTNEQYGRFLEYVRATSDHSKCHPDEPEGKDHTPALWTDPRWNGPKQPVVGVDWWDAYAYAAWAGKRLPVRGEWERAALGTDERRYPWGNEWDVAKCNSGESAKGVTVEVGSYPQGRSPYGCMDMAGNVYEWCADVSRAENAGSAQGAGSDAAPPAITRLELGSSWADSMHTCVRAAFGWYTPEKRFNNIGFRCVRTY